MQSTNLELAIKVRKKALELGYKLPAANLKTLINKGWNHLYVPIFGEQSIDGLASHHIEAIQWHWESRLDLLNNRTPTYDAYFPIWSRGHNKSGIARRLAIIDGILSRAYTQPGYCLYLSRNKEMALKHSKSVETLLQSRRTQRWCPSLATEQVNEQKRSKGWTAKFIYTAANMIYHFAGLDEGLAGGNLETNVESGSEDRADVRVTFFVLDDIDDRSDSPVIAESRLNTLTGEVLPMGQANTLTFFAQNLITRSSTMYRIQTQQVHVLTGRKPSQPIKAVKDFKAEQVTTADGIIQDRFVSGEPTWQAWDAKRVQLEINRFGLPAFLRECHPAGTRVRVGRNTNTPIEQIRVGDVVLTHKNRMCQVTDLVRREYTGELYKFKLANASIPLVATANHPFLSAVPSVNWRWQGKNKNPDNLNIAWHKASELRKGTYLLEPMPLTPRDPLDGRAVWMFKDALQGRPAKGHREIVATPELFRLLGYYLAEGRVDGGSVSLTFHENETEYIKDVVQLFADVFGVEARKRPDNGRAVRIECASIIAAKFFLSVGVGSHFKSVPKWAFNVSDALITQLFLGYWRGDGCKDPSGFAYNTVSEQLAEHMRLLLLRLGIVAGLYRLKERDIRLPQGTQYRRSMHWQGDINGYYAVKLGKLLGVPHQGKGTRRSCFIHAGYVWKPIRSVTTEGVEDFPVFNLEVETDKSYIAENVVSHNCQHEVEQSKEGVILYNYDDNVHVISESEFASVFGSIDAWLSWRKKPGNDWARTKTDKHANVAAWLARSPADSSLPNFTFLMYPMSFPANSAPEDVAERLLSCLSPYAYGQTLWSDLRKDVLRRAKSDVYAKTVSDKIDYEHGELAQVVPGYAKPLLQRCNVQQGEMSHEQDTVRKLYSRIYGIGMRPINPRRSGGIEDINRAMRVDYETKHAFREGAGYSQFHLVVPDDAGRGAYTEINGVGVYHPRTYPLAIQTADLSDSDLWRYQFSNCRYREPLLTATGQEIDLILKLYDDSVNLMQMWACGSPLAGSSLTHEQKVQMLIPAAIKEGVKTSQLGFMDYEFQKEIIETSLRPANFDPLEFFE